MSNKTGQPIRILHLARRSPNESVWSGVFKEELQKLGELTIRHDGDGMTDGEAAELCRSNDVIIADWGSRGLPSELADNPGRLRYVCSVTGSIRSFVPRVFIEKGLLVSNWGTSPAYGIAEGAFALLMTSLKELVPIRNHIGHDGWGVPESVRMGSLQNLRLGVYGLGAIGTQFVNFVRAFGPELSAYDPYCEDWPEGVNRMDSLEELFRHAHAIVILTALSEETRGSVDARRLSLLCDHGIIINVARGAIIDQEALFLELESGRLRAGLDVFDTEGKDWVPPGHPARAWPNLIMTPHKIGSSRWNSELEGSDKLSRKHEIALDNIRRYREGETPRFTFDLNRYDRST